MIKKIFTSLAGYGARVKNAVRRDGDDGAGEFIAFTGVYADVKVNLDAPSYRGFGTANFTVEPCGGGLLRLSGPEFSLTGVVPLRLDLELDGLKKSPQGETCDFRVKCQPVVFTGKRRYDGSGRLTVGPDGVRTLQLQIKTPVNGGFFVTIACQSEGK